MDQQLNEQLNAKRFNDIEKYIHIVDSAIVETNCEQIEMIDSTLIFHSDFSGTVQVIHDLKNENVNINYQFNENVHMNLIEVHRNEQECHLVRDFDFKEYANVAIFSLNDANNKLAINDHASIETGAEIECAYGELSLTDVEANYIYDLNGIESRVYIRNAVLSSNQRKKHYELTFNHNAPNTYGQMDNYGVVKDSSKLIFDSIGRIQRGNSKSATHQKNKIMVFDEGCQAQANPYLYIDEYDVQASHAAGLGKMDEDHLFYLQSRGLTKNQSMKLITYGYLMPCVDVIDNEEVKDLFAQTLEERMGD